MQISRCLHSFIHEPFSFSFTFLQFHWILGTMYGTFYSTIARIILPFLSNLLPLLLLMTCGNLRFIIWDSHFVEKHLFWSRGSMSEYQNKRTWFHCYIVVCSDSSLSSGLYRTHKKIFFLDSSIIIKIICLPWWHLTRQPQQHQGQQTATSSHDTWQSRSRWQPPP